LPAIGLICRPSNSLPLNCLHSPTESASDPVTCDFYYFWPTRAELNFSQSVKRKKKGILIVVIQKDLAFCQFFLDAEVQE